MTTMNDFDPDDVPTGVHELPSTMRVWATKSELKHRQLRKEHDLMATDVKDLSLAIMGDGRDPKKPGLIMKVDRIMTAVTVLLVLVSVASVLMPALFWLLHAAAK
jgi:hypothetical protein